MRSRQSPAATTTDEPASSTGGDKRPADELPLGELLAEDFITHDRNIAEPGFWAIAVHRLGSRAGRVSPPAVRRPLEVSQKALATLVDWVWGIQVTRSTKVGRRVRIWHNGSILLEAASIGNDVQIRHDTTFGPARGHGPKDPDSLPVVEDGVDIGSGACVLGPVRVGQNAFVGANSVVLESVPAGARVLGVPAKLIPAWVAAKKS